MTDDQGSGKNSGRKKKDLTSLLELPPAPERTASLIRPEELPTGEESPPGEAPVEFQTSQDSSVDPAPFGSLDFGSDEASTASEPALGGNEFTSPPASDPLADLPPLDPSITALAEGTATTSAPTSENDFSSASFETPLPDEPTAAAAPEAAVPETATPETPTHPTLKKIREYSDTMAPAGGAPAIASTPYSLLIEGPLRTHEREKLLEILSRERLGIREVEIEAQLDAGRILIPRISEFAGVLLVQALRNSTASLRLGPSEKIFASTDAQENAFEFASEGRTDTIHLDDSDLRSIPVTTEQTFEEATSLRVVDTIHASLLVQAAQVVGAQSRSLQESIEKLKNQLKLQARFRGANGIVSFRTELHPNAERSHYTILAQGVAVHLESSRS